jgi:hypothetical protein
VGKRHGDVVGGLFDGSRLTIDGDLVGAQRTAEVVISLICSVARTVSIACPDSRRAAGSQLRSRS